MQYQNTVLEALELIIEQEVSDEMLSDALSQTAHFLGGISLVD